MFVLWLLSVLLSTIHTESAELDQQCIGNCSCCIERLCGETASYPNSCLKGCIDGHRGARCYQLCQYKNCKFCGGTTTSEVCEECYDGYYLGEKNNCTLHCPSNCKSCISSKNCTECKDGFYNENNSTTCEYAYCPIYCNCTAKPGDCVSCKTGYYNTSNSCKNQCPVNCLMCESNKSCNECKSGYYNGYKFDYDHNLQLNNCTYACRQSCVQCNSYNNCSQCIKGKYGLTCQDDCSVGCKDNTCSIDNGQCYCTKDFTGGECMECVDGKFGPFCNQTCSRYCKNHKCERTSGVCIDGCTSMNTTRETCDTCIAGTYGELCAMVCPKYCRNSICHRYNGSCIEGCLGNFNGVKCDLCIPGKYGQDCTLDCPVKCADGICERKSGTCYKCIGQFEGTACTECKSGYFGPECHDTCSEHCSNSTCDINNGVCMHGCTDGYSGDRCCVMSKHCVACYSNTECKTCERGYFMYSCNVSCPDDCLDVCDISTGECSNCQNNRYGQFCDLNCSENCKYEEITKNRACARSDGKCYGCQDGFYSPTCNHACSSLCIGKTCRQDDGVCINGCETHQTQPECILSEGIQQQKDGSSTGVITAVLVSILILSLAVNIGLLVVCAIKKIKNCRGRAQNAAVYENQLHCIGAQLPRTSATDTIHSEIVGRNVYESIGRGNEQEHEYQQVTFDHDAILMQTKKSDFR